MPNEQQRAEAATRERPSEQEGDAANGAGGKRPAQAKEKQSPLWGILSFAGQRKGQLWLSVVLSVLSVFCGLLPYVCIAWLITGFLDGDMSLVVAAALSAVAFAGYVAKGLLHTKATLSSHKAAFEIIRNIRVAIMEKMARLPLGTIQRKPSGEFKQVVIDETERLEYPIAHVIPELTSSILVPVAVVAYLFTIDWRMALASLVSTVIGLTVYGCMTIGRGPMMQRYMQANSDMNATVVEYINGMEVVKAFGRSADSLDRFTGAIVRVRDVTTAWFRHCWPFMSVSQAIMPSTIAFVLPVGMLLIMEGTLGLSQLIICIVLSLGIVGAIQKVMEFMENFATIFEVQPRIQELLDMDELPEPHQAQMPQGSQVRLENVSFTYDKAEVIHGVSFTAAPGTTTALVGPSGSGKSTLAKLIARFWDVGSGAVTIGGTDIRDMPLEALMDHISYVSQDNYLFNMSLRENIRVGCPTATDAQVELVAKRAGCEEFIARFAEGYDTQAGDAGDRLSGGERQRIALARALLKDAPLVILDEATAFTDPESEAKLQRSIDMLTRDKTLIVIAHRLSTIMYADAIIVLEDGRISAQGTHEQLLQNSSTYQTMWQTHTQAMDWSVRDKRADVTKGGALCGA